MLETRKAVTKRQTKKDRVLLRRRALSEVLLAWLRASGVDQISLSAATALDPATINKLIHGRDGVALEKEYIEAIGKACGVKDLTPGYEAAGYIIGGTKSSLPSGLVAALGTWEDWEMDILTEQLDSFKSMIQSIKILTMSPTVASKKRRTRKLESVQHEGGEDAKETEPGEIQRPGRNLHGS